MRIVASGEFYRVVLLETRAWVIEGIENLRSGIAVEFTPQEAADRQFSKFRERRYWDRRTLDERCIEILSVFYDEDIL